MSLSAAAEAMGLPEALVQRSAEARAAETGQSVDEILAAWAGGETVAPSAPAASVEADTRETGPNGEAEPVPEPEPPTPVIETFTEAPAPTTVSTRAPAPTEVTAAEAAHLPEVITVPTAGIKERTDFVIPTWLTSLLLVIPLVALFALGGSSTGACGEATELDVDVISGNAVNCDGSEFTGSAQGGGATDYIAMGDEIFHGNAVAGVNCAGCHGANGQGGVGPALSGVLTTFAACADHEEWVTVGSDGFGVGNSYGDTNKTVNGGMPGFGGSLTEEQIAAVASFERVRFGGADPEETLADCGLGESSGENGAPAGGENGGSGTTVPADGGGTGTTLPTEGDGTTQTSVAVSS